MRKYEILRVELSKGKWPYIPEAVHGRLVGVVALANMLTMFGLYKHVEGNGAKFVKYVSRMAKVDLDK